VLGRVWARLPELDRRLSITELPAKKGLDYELSDCIGRCFTRDGKQSWARLMPLSRRPQFPVGKRPDAEEEPPDEGVGRLSKRDELYLVVEIVPALPEEADDMRVRQLAGVRRFLESVVGNREAAGVSGLADSVRRKAKTEQQTKKRAQGGVR
jgi:hypothetical protein